jgi:hypothetical protein
MERPGASPAEIERFFTGLAAFFRTSGQASRGCLMINTIAEDEDRGTLLDGQAQAFRDRLHAAFANALAGRTTPACRSNGHSFSPLPRSVSGWPPASAPPALPGPAMPPPHASAAGSGPVSRDRDAMRPYLPVLDMNPLAVDAGPSQRGGSPSSPPSPASCPL